MHQIGRAETRSVEVRGGRLPVRWRAGRSPTLLFLHYWGGSQRSFDAVIDRLTSGCAVVTYDQRGWGGAGKLPGPYRIGQLAADALAVAADLGHGSFVLIGHSMGAKVAQLAASQRPLGLRGLVLVAPAPPRPTIDQADVARRSHAYDDRSTVNAALDRALTHRALHSDLREQVVVDSLAASREATLAWPLHGMTDDITAAAAQIDVPVHVVAGEHDLVDSPDSLVADLLPFIPGARMTIIEGSGHLSPYEVPELVACEIDRFIADLEPPHD